MINKVNFIVIIKINCIMMIKIENNTIIIRI